MASRGLDVWRDEPTGRGLGGTLVSVGRTGAWSSTARPGGFPVTEGKARWGRLRSVGWFLRSAVEALGLVLLFVTSHFAAIAVREWWASFTVTAGLLGFLLAVVTCGLIFHIGTQIRVRENEGRVIPWRLW